MSELKPCPFCGGEPYIQSEPLDDKRLYEAGCADCQIEFIRDTEADAIAAWNRRDEKGADHGNC